MMRWRAGDAEQQQEAADVPRRCASLDMEIEGEAPEAEADQQQHASTTATPSSSCSSSSSSLDDIKNNPQKFSEQKTTTTAASSSAMAADDREIHKRSPRQQCLNNENECKLEEEKKQDHDGETKEEALPDPKAVPPDDDDDAGGGEQSEKDDDENDVTEKTVVWKPQNESSTVEFSHTIMDYASKRDSGCKKAEYSPTTVDEYGNRWRLIVYVNGNGRASNHHLSLFLQVADADDLPFGWKKAVSYVLTLEHPDGGSLNYAKRNPDKTFKLCPKAIDWGWSQFITSDRIQQEGFVSNDSLTVRASVTVKSSSVTIDKEDAELYLKCAVEEGNADAVKLCLEQGASVNCKFKDDLYTPLHTSCSSGTGKGSIDVLNLLLERGADGNACNKWRETPLLIAANNGHKAAVQALLKHDADPSLCSEAGWSALTFAAHKGYENIVTLLLKAGAPVNTRVTEDNSTPLHKACAGSKPGHLGAVKQLLDANADVHALNKWRETPLLTAANHGQAGAVEALLAAGADPCKCTDTGWSPLSIAAYKGHDDVVRLLLEEGAPTEEDDPTLSALLQAATKGLTRTVELLLENGADHTVTTKKGDTALSILVEQNLIDAAVEMVTEYNASISRCSRDRKKIQRARLLINHRMKQIQREGKNTSPCTDDDESSEEESGGSRPVQLEKGSMPASQSRSKKKKKKNKGQKMTPEEKARAAEEALLLELEQEDAKARKEEAEANSKREKKRKKKERERQQKMKEEQERREREELEAKEHERLRKEKEEQQRKEQEMKLKEKREREMKEMMEREKSLAAKRKERERREREQKQRVKDTVASSPSSGSDISEKSPRDKKAGRMSKSISESGADSDVVPLAGNRRWETKAKVRSTSMVDVRTSFPEQAPSVLRTDRAPSLPRSASAPVKGDPVPSTFLPPRPSSGMSEGLPNLIAQDNNARSNGTQHAPQAKNEVSSQYGGPMIEHPAVTLLRREKVSEIIRRCAQTTNLVGEPTIRRVIHRWIVRAAHDQTPYADPLIPSWRDFDQLVAFFQRQFISESRRRESAGSAPRRSIEELKEAGSSVALLCQNLAKEVEQARHRIEARLPPDWNDAALGMTASEGMRNCNESVVTLSWASRAAVCVHSSTFASLRSRYVGPSDRFLVAVFVAKIWYETKRQIVSDTAMDVRLPPETQACLSSEAAVSAELWSDPFTTFGSNIFWGNFKEVDCFFGGQKPFGSDGRSDSSEVVALHGGSISVLPPFDNLIASRYVQRMLDILDSSNTSSAPVSFALFLHADCFHDLPNGPSISDLHRLDPRLGEPKSEYIQHVECLQAGRHAYHTGEASVGTSVCPTNSLFVLLQNKAGRSRFQISSSSLTKIIGSMSSDMSSPSEDPVVPPIGLANDFSTHRESPLTAQPSYFDGLAPMSPAPMSPDPQRVVQSDFGTIGGTAIAKAFSPSNEQLPRGSRHGRLFDLIEDGEDEQVNGIDLVSGMLNNLDAGLFQNGNIGSDVDIEAISLMGIGGPPPPSLHSSSSAPLHPSNSQHGRFG